MTQSTLLMRHLKTEPMPPEAMGPRTSTSEAGQTKFEGNLRRRGANSSPNSEKVSFIVGEVNEEEEDAAAAAVGVVVEPPAKERFERAVLSSDAVECVGAADPEVTLLSPPPPAALS